MFIPFLSVCVQSQINKYCHLKLDHQNIVKGNVNGNYDCLSPEIFEDKKNNRISLSTGKSVSIEGVCCAESAK